MSTEQGAEHAQDRQPHEREGVESESSLNVAVQQCSTHSGTTTERAVPTGQSTERAGQPNPCGCVKGAEGKSAGKEGAHVCSGTRSPE